MRILKKFIDTFCIWLITDIPGGLGQRIRFFYWRRRFMSCGNNIRIDQGVIFNNPENIILKSNIWIHGYSILTAPAKEVTHAKNKNIIENKKGKLLEIGNEVQIGSYNIINGIGGIDIKDCVTLSAGVSIYSSTHLPNNPEDFSMPIGHNGMVRSRQVFSKNHKVTIETGAWLGLDAKIICASVGEESFIKSGCIITKDVKPNSVIGLNGYQGEHYFKK